MTDSEMASAVIWGVIGWLCLVAFCLAAIFVLCRKDPMVPLPDPAFRDRPSVEDLKLALEHDALVDEVEVAWLKSVWNLPAREPSR